ncbi:MAG: hypothetical protein QN131_06515 [Armatimonadota bacterium]|nr:hypothetical protein [Armatimonadota bacterium]MDR7549577.1 hypothetical protein [Armatimonadota bacterium]
MHRPRWAGWAVAALLALAAGAGTGVARPRWVTYRHPGLGFSIGYPAGWTVKTANLPPGVQVLIEGPRSAGSATVPLTVGVTVTPVPFDTSIDDFFDDREDAAQRAPRSSGYQRLRLSGAHIGGLPAILWYFVQQVGGSVRLYHIHLLVVDGLRGYSVTATTSASSPRLRDETQLLQDSLMTFRPR